MEGLEISEVNLTTVQACEIRLEGKYYSQNLGAISFVPAREIVEQAQYNSIYGMNEIGKGYPAIRMNEFDTVFTGTPAQFAQNFTEDDFQVHRLVKNDILICRTNGNPNLVGKSALVAKDYPYVYESHLFKVRPKQQIISSALLVVFLNSKFGRLEINRLSMSGNQANFSLAKFLEIRIPQFKDINKTVEEVVFLAFNQLEKSKIIYALAETLLLETLGLTNFTPSTEAVNIKSFKDSFSTTGRLDAEYYQPKYEQMVAYIAAKPHDKLSALVNIQKSIEPGSDAYSEDAQGLPFLRVADYSKQGITAPQVGLGEKFVKENAEKLNALKPKQDTILFSKDGSVGEAYCLREDASFITSGAILHLTVKDKTQVLPDYLTLVLNSLLVRQQAERDAGGSIILHWRKEEIENVLVPVIDMPTQQKIAAQIQTSFKLKAESERLLEVAKRAVEIAIEQDEAAGMNYIAQQAT